MHNDFHGSPHMKANKIFPTFPPSRLPIQTVVVQGGRGGFGERKSTLCPPCLAVACPRQTHLCSDLEVGTILVDKAPAGASPNPRLVGQEGSGGLWRGQLEVWGCSKLISSCPDQSLEKKHNDQKISDWHIKNKFGTGKWYRSYSGLQIHLI